jgi:hypothetical protein
VAEPLGHERQVSFFRQGGHDHDGENSTPVVILPGAIQLYHLNDALLDYLRELSGEGGGGSDEDGVFPTPDLTFQTPPISPGASHEGSVSWVGISFVRFMRVLQSVDTECTITFYHKSTYADEDREFRAYKCSNKFLWEGTWGHFDEDETKQLHYKIENTGNQSATFQITIKSGTMAANAYSRFVEALIVNGTELLGTIPMLSGNGVELEVTGNGITFNATAPETVYVRRWALTPVKPSAFTSSASITNVAYLSTGREDQAAQFGAGSQWIMADLGAVYNLGAVRISQYQSDGRTFNGVKIELSSDATTWFEIKSSGSAWAVQEGTTVHIASGYLARYIRLWCNGSTVDTNNYVNKIIPLVIGNKG